MGEVKEQKGNGRDHIIELKKQRFRFLEKLYDESNADPDHVSFLSWISILAHIDNSSLDGIVKYLESEGLIRLQKRDPPPRPLPNDELNMNWLMYPFTKDEVRITHEGIKEVENSRDQPDNPTQHFPPYQTIYNIDGNYYETDRVMGDIFRDIHNATIINKSLVENSFNKVKKEYDEETSKALVEVAEFIEKSKNPAAGALFDSFNQELNKSQPDKSRLKSFWEGIQNALPAIVSISTSVAKIVSLFA